MPKWQNEYRKCENCRREYRPQREAQSYCSRNCRRAAAYGRERFQSGTRGPRRRLLTPRLEARRSIEASETLPGRVVAGSFRKLGFYSTKSEACKGGNTPVLVQDRQWSHLYPGRRDLGARKPDAVQGCNPQLGGDKPLGGRMSGPVPSFTMFPGPRWMDTEPHQPGRIQGGNLSGLATQKTVA